MALIQFSGLASGIDSKSLIDALIEARNKTNELRQAEIDHITSENTALDELGSKINTLKDLVEKLRVVNGGGVYKRAASSNADVATAIAGSDAVSSSVSVNVTSIADTATQSLKPSSSSGWASSSSAFTSGSGTVEIDVGSATGGSQVTISVAVTAATTVQQFVEAINNDASASGRVSASLINVGTSGSPAYQVVLNTLKSGTVQGEIAVTVPGGITDLSAPSAKQATDAQFTISGISGTITRESNTVDDVVPGLTMQFLSSGATNISVTEDASSTADLMNQIVDAYNDIVSYVNENDIVERLADGTNVYGTLAKTRTDNEFLSSFRAQLFGASSSTGTSVTSISELGIATNRDGTLSFDQNTFETAVGNDPTGAAEVLQDLGEGLGGISGVLHQYVTYNGFIDVAKNSNEDQIEQIQEKMTKLDYVNGRLRESLEGQFARLESLMAKLQNQGSALSSILAGLTQ